MLPFQIIQGGMGVAVSNWNLARTVSKLGQLGVVSGTGLAAVLARRLQTGDHGAHLRRALAHFPIPRIAKDILDRYFAPWGISGKPAHVPFILAPLPQLDEAVDSIELTVAANFVEVFLAKENHPSPVGINYLEKVQIPHLASLYGAMLAGVDYVLMGAGIPRFIPAVLDNFALGKAASYPIAIDNPLAAGGREEVVMNFDPAVFFGRAAPELMRPMFFPIISSATLAITLARKSNGRIDGFIVEGKTAGGHNAPPRGPVTRNARGEPIYGPRDIPELDKIRDLGLPFYLAGGFGRPGKLAEALEVGAAGIQVGTAFAFCNESGLSTEIKRRAIANARQQVADVFTDPLASPTGFPIKIMQLEGSLSETERFQQRTRVCDLGYLRKPCRLADNSIGYRCPAEPTDQYVRKGGVTAETDGRKCLCNALFANIGLPQARPGNAGGNELPIITAGDDALFVDMFLPPGKTTYSAADVIAHLMQPVHS